MVRRLLLSALVLCAAALGPIGCGSGGDDETRGARRGSFVFALPFVPATGTETITLGFKNVTTTDAPVRVTPFMADGTPYAGGTTTVVVPGQGELRRTLASLLGAAPAGGWVHVDTRDTTTLDAVTGEPVPLATSGFVFPYIERDVLGSAAEQDALGGLAPRADEVRVCVSSRTYAVQLINHSVMEMGGGSVPLAVSFDVELVGADGTTVPAAGSPFVVAGNATVALPFSPPFGSIGFVRVTPTAAPAAGELRRFSISSREFTLQNHAEGRYREASDSVFPGLVEMGFDVEHGPDGDGNIHDFGVMLCNGSTSSQTVTLFAVFRRGGLPILTTPRLFNLRAGRSVFMGTTNSVSFGLEGAEVSWFNDIFGDAFSAGGLEAVTLYIQAPRAVDVSARHFDASGASFYRVLTSYPRTNRACHYDVPIATSTLSTRRSWLVITNTGTGPLTVPVRVYTPILGTEYALPDIVVPPQSRLDWSPDGIQLREEPTDTVGPFVQFLRIDMVPNVGALFGGRVESRDGGGQLTYIRPTLQRSN